MSLAVLSPPVVVPEVEDAQRQALLALRSRIKPSELAYRRSLLAGAVRFFGLDIHKDYLTLTAVDADLNTVVRLTTLTWERFPAWVEQHLTDRDAVAVEVTTNTWDTVDALVDHVHTVIVVHPPHVKLITDMQVMTDRKASEALATLLACGLLRPVWVPDLKHREWRHLIATRFDHVVAATKTKNRLHSVLHRHHLKPPARLPFLSKHREWWLSLAVSPVEALTVRQCLDGLEFHKARIAEIELVMARELIADERLPYILQVAGVGLVGAMTILSAIGPIERFPDERKLVGYAGLGARIHNSGKRKTTGRITKTGRIDLRSAMIAAAHAAKRVNPHWKGEFQRLMRRIGKHKATVAIARKLLVSIWHILTRREVDRYMTSAALATTFTAFVYGELGGTADLPGGLSALEFVRGMLDQLQVGKELQYVKVNRKRFVLPQSCQPGAAPVPAPKHNGQRQNTRAAKAARAAGAAQKRAELEARRAAAEARRGRPRKERSDKGTRRGPNKATRVKVSQPEKTAPSTA